MHPRCACPRLHSYHLPLHPHHLSPSPPHIERSNDMVKDAQHEDTKTDENTHVVDDASSGQQGLYNETSRVLDATIGAQH